MTDDTRSATARASGRLSALHIDRSSAPRTRTSRHWVWIVLLVALLVTVSGWKLALHATEVDVTTVVAVPPSLQAVQLTASGYVVAQRRAAVASKATGRLVELYVREGSRVKAGELLARLDASDVQAALLAAEAGIHQAEAGVQQALAAHANAQEELKRSLGLQAQGFISPQAVDSAQTRARASQAALDAARAALQAAKAQRQVQQVNREFTEIRAPFEGVVLVKNANVGDIITPFSSAAGSQGAVVTMADMSTLEVEADVSEGSLSRVAIGQPVEILLDALPGVRLRGTVGGIVPTVDRAKATVMTKVKFDRLDPRVLPEMSAKVNFLSRPVSDEELKPVLAVNPAALARHEGRDVLWRLQPMDAAPGSGAASSPASAAAPAADQRWVVQPVPVQPGALLGDVRALRAADGVAPALQSGDRVVLKPEEDLKPGTKVQPRAR